MRMIGKLLSGLAILGATSSCDGQANPVSARTFYIDYDRGADTNGGLSAADAWQHAPGDPTATAKPAGTSLQPGDQILFAPGVRYRGEVKLAQSGSSGAPITFASAPGDKQAIIDGSDPIASVRSCKAASECGNVTQWQRLHRIDLGTSLTKRSALFAGGRALYEAQEPNPSDPFYRDKIAEFIEVSGSKLEQGQAPIGRSAAQLIGDGQSAWLHLWVRPNRIERRPVSYVADGIAFFDTQGLTHYADRPSRVAVVGHPALIDQPGEYAMIDQTTAVAWLPPGTTQVSVATGRGGININGQSHIRVHNLAFEHMSDLGRDGRSGIAVLNHVRGARGIEVSNNRFSRFAMPVGQGVIGMRAIEDVSILNNTIDHIADGSGMRISGPTRNVQIVGNRITKIGRTAIMLMGVTDGVIAENMIHDISGVHGNGLSVYRDNSGIRIFANSIWDATRPATFHGDFGKSGKPTNLSILNNVFLGTPDTQAALSSWGKKTQSVLIEGNVMISAKVGALLAPADEGVVVRNNIISGILFGKGEPVGWVITDNVFTHLTWQKHKGDRATIKAGLAAFAPKLIGATTAPEELCRYLPTYLDPKGFRIGATARCPAAPAPQ